MAGYDFKTKKFDGKKSKAEMFWEYELLPAMVDVEFLFKIAFDLNAIKADYTTERGDLDLNEFYYDVINADLSERSILRKSKALNVPGFKVTFVTYKGELEVRSLNPQGKAQQFGYNVVLEALDRKKQYTNAEIQQIVAKFIALFEQSVLKDSSYYKFTK
ncbi:MAG TPA: hypothetical protein PLY35_08405 [Thermotogota bacterium]|nr:hypothetical protein [Thermotogota bacterium]